MRIVYVIVIAVKPFTFHVLRCHNRPYFILCTWSMIVLPSTCTGELSGPGAELLVRFHTSSEDRPRYTIRTHGDTDMIVALLGPDDSTRVIQ